MSTHVSRSRTVTFRHYAAAVLALAGLAAPPASAQNIANGQQLYDSICRVCHGFPPAGGPERAAGNPLVIRNAINGGVPTMSFLGSLLTQQDIADIAAWLFSLANAPTNPVPANDYTDLWWNAAEDGWGLNLIQHPSNIIFGVMYTYDAQRRPAWFVLPGGTWLSPVLYEGAFYRVTGPHFNMATFNPANVMVRPVGTARLTFSSRDAGNFVFTVDGVQVTKPITRQPF